jgi:hypothetical protein
MLEEHPDIIGPARWGQIMPDSYVRRSVAAPQTTQKAEDLALLPL